jgi:hypothetical protein
MALSISHAVHVCSHANRLALSSWVNTYQTLNLISLSHELDILRLNNIIDFVVNGYLESFRPRGIVQYGQSLVFFPPPQFMAACGWLIASNYLGIDVEYRCRHLHMSVLSITPSIRAIAHAVIAQQHPCLPQHQVCPTSPSQVLAPPRAIVSLSHCSLSLLPPATSRSCGRHRP